MRRIKTYFNLPDSIQDESDAHQLLSSQQDPIADYIRENNSTSYKAIEAYADPEKLATSIRQLQGRLDQIERTVDSVGTSVGNNAIKIQNLNGSLNVEIEDRKAGDLTLSEQLEVNTTNIQDLGKSLQNETKDRKSEISNLSSSLSNEIKDREALDSNLSPRVKALEDNSSGVNAVKIPLECPIGSKIQLFCQNSSYPELTGVFDRVQGNYNDRYLLFDKELTLKGSLNVLLKFDGSTYQPWEFGPSEINKFYIVKTPDPPVYVKIVKITLPKREEKLN